MEEEEEEEENATAGVPLDVPSNRTSLIITHEDGTVEENEGEVTCLGLTPDLERKSKISIEEVSPPEDQTSPAARPGTEVRSQ